MLTPVFVLVACPVNPFVLVPCDVIPFVFVQCDFNQFVFMPCDVNPFVPVPCDVNPFVLVPCDVNPFVPVLCDINPFVFVPCDVNPCLWSRVKRCSQHGAAHPQALQDPHSLRGPPGLEAARRKHAYRPPQGQGQDTTQKAVESGRTMMINKNSNDQSTRFTVIITHKIREKKKKKTNYTYITLHIACFRKGP